MQTKTVVTIGPSSLESGVLEDLIDAGMSIARLNFSRSTGEEYSAVKARIATHCQKVGKTVEILADLQGPRVRIANIPEGGVKISKGETVIFRANPKSGEYNFDHQELYADIKANDTIFIANGATELLVTEKAESMLKAKVIRGGHLYPKKGINLPDTNLSFSGLTDKDRADLEYVLGPGGGADYVAISFVQERGDVDELREIVNGHAKIVSKIETKLALETLNYETQSTPFYSPTPNNPTQVGFSRLSNLYTYSREDCEVGFSSYLKT